MDKPTFQTPIHFRIESFFIDDEIILDNYVVLDGSTHGDTVSMVIMDVTSFIYQDHYVAIKVIDDNISQYPKADLGDYIISWRSSDTDDGLEQLVYSEIGSYIEIRYIDIDFDSTIDIPEDLSDLTNWDNSFFIVSESGDNGTVTPEGSYLLEYGSDYTITITPDTNYDILDVMVNGESVGAVTSWTFSDIDSNNNISASFVVKL